MTPAIPTPADRRLYGDLVDAVYELRAAGFDVARFKGDYRVGKDVLTAAELRAKAADLRNRRQARKPDASRSPMARHEIERPRERPVQPVPAGGGDGTVAASDPGSPSTKPTADVRDKFWRAAGPQDATPHERVDDGTHVVPLLSSSQAEGVDAPTAKPAPKAGTGAGTDICGCGRPDAHGGRCWARRGWPGPDKGPTAIKRAKEPARAARDGNIAALWAEVDALKSTVERMRKQLAMELGR